MKKSVVWLYPKLEKWMGGTKFVFECSKRLSEEFALKVICQKGTDEVLEVFNENGIETYQLNSLSFTDTSFWLRFNKSIHKDITSLSKYINPETVIISSMYPLNFVASQFPNKHVQIIYEPFSFFYSKNLYKDYGIRIDLFFKVISKIFKNTDLVATKKANIVLTLSEYEKNNIKKIYGVDSAVIYEGVDDKMFFPRDTADLNKMYPYKIPLMHSTGFDSYKGTDLVIKALPELKKHYNFILFITYTRENKVKMNEYIVFIKSNNLQENVRFLQFLPIEKLPEYYSFAKIYLEPGKGRSMSLSNKEAMACGTPVIRGNDSAEEVTDGYNGFLTSPDDPQELVEKIVKLLGNEILQKQMSKNAIESVKDRFSWDSVVAKIINHI